MDNALYTVYIKKFVVFKIRFPCTRNTPSQITNQWDVRALMCVALARIHRIFKPRASWHFGMGSKELFILIENPFSYLQNVVWLSRQSCLKVVFLCFFWLLMTISTPCVRQIIDDECQLFENSIIIGKSIRFRTFYTNNVYYSVLITYEMVFR